MLASDILIDMKPGVYLETTVISYLTARPSRDMVIAAHQELTRQWWTTRTGAFNLFVSELVRLEAGKGDAEAADKRITAIDEISILRTSEEAIVLADQLVSGGPIPSEAMADALHVAIAAVHGIDFLLTWNCAHLANAVHRHRLEAVIEGAGYTCPVICTPEELMEE
jgi:hypothetical protein